MGRQEEEILGIFLIGGMLYYGYKTGILDQLVEKIGGFLDGAVNSIGSIGGNTNTNTGGNTNSGGNTNTGGNVNSGAAIKIGAFADIGSGRNSNWKAVVNQMKSKGVTVVIVPGDFSYTDEGDFEEVSKAVKAFAKFLGAEGNHDGGGYSSLFDNFSNFVTTIGDTSFMGLNTESISSAVSYAKANLSKMTGKWKIVFFHKPIYTVKSDHGNESGMKPLVAEFEKAGVNLVVQAHNHNYQRFQPVNGVTYVVSGLGGEGDKYSLGANPSGNPPVAKTYNGGFGYLHIETGASLKCAFISSSGSTIDSFTIQPKTANMAFVRASSAYRIL